MAWGPLSWLPWPPCLPCPYKGTLVIHFDDMQMTWTPNGSLGTLMLLVSMPSKVAPSIIHAITCLSLHPSIQTKMTKKTKAKLVGPHEKTLGGVHGSMRSQWAHAMRGKGAHACLLTSQDTWAEIGRTLLQIQIRCTSRSRLDARRTSMERPLIHLYRTGFRFQNDQVSGARQPQVWRHPYEAVGS